MAPDAFSSSSDSAFHHARGDISAVVIFIDFAWIEAPYDLFFRATLLAPLVEPLHYVDCTPDFELDCFLVLRIFEFDGEIR